MIATMPRIFRNTRLLYVAGALLLLLALAPAFANNNTTPTTSAGAGSAGVSGYTLSDTLITLNPGNPTLIDEVRFTATADGGVTADTPTTVLVRFDSGVVDHLTLLDCPSPAPRRASRSRATRLTSMESESPGWTRSPSPG